MVVIHPSPDVSYTEISDSILVVIREQREQYFRALSRLDATTGRDVSALNEVLRIAYNFASDATGFLRLIVSIFCNLKHLWSCGAPSQSTMLFQRHSRRLPWTRSKSQANPENYQLNIGDARNSAFHDLFPASTKPSGFELPTDAIGDPSLTIFSEHSKKSANSSPSGKELVDVLIELARAEMRGAVGTLAEEPRCHGSNYQTLQGDRQLRRKMHKAKSLAG